MKCFSLNIRLAIDCSKEIVVNLQRNRIGIVIIIAKERGLVDDCLAQEFFSLKVFRHGIKNLSHAESLLFKGMFFQCRKTVGDGP